MNAALKDKLRNLPTEPGVYLMKNGQDEIIYVGKAKNLKNRVASYFGTQDHAKTRALVSQISAFDIIMTKTEVEALLLERTLIKHHDPKFNVLLRDDKEYPYLKVNFDDPWPRLKKVRRRKEDGATYLGPFGSASRLKTMVDLAGRIFPLIRCSEHEFKNAKRPCNYYHMKMCLGPCVLDVDRNDYIAVMKNAVAFLQGRDKDLLKELKTKMFEASDTERFELAASYRDQISAFESITEKQSVVVDEVASADVIAFERHEQHCAFHVLFVRDHKHIGGESFVLKSLLEDDDDILKQFLLQFYEHRYIAPLLILENDCVAEDDALMDVLSSQYSDTRKKLTTHSPKKGNKKNLLDMAQKNANYALEEIVRKEQRGRASLEMIKETLELPTLPERMECIDISNMGETAIVASNVCFKRGKPSKADYRLYNIQSVQGGPDDFASMREVVTRRIERMLRDEDKPDLLLIDGGKGQLSAAMDSLRNFPDVSLQIRSIAKSRTMDHSGPESLVRARSPERIFFPDKQIAVPLEEGTPAYRVLTMLRDEAHRFAITHHRKKRSKELHSSSLEDIPGVGPVLRKRLLEVFGSLDSMKQANVEELMEIKGVSEDLAETIYKHLSSTSSE